MLKIENVEELTIESNMFWGGESRALGPLGAPGPDVKVRGERILLKGLRGECQGPGPLGAPGPDVKVRGDRVLHHGTTPT